MLPKPPTTVEKVAAPEGPPAFQAWLLANPDQAPRYEKFKAYLAREGVLDVLPAYSLVQTESEEAIARCEIAPYAIPDEALWPAMIPTLRLVRAHIVPTLGPVQVLSSYRTNAANRCAQGAPNSPHTRFGALDLQLVGDMPQKEMFAKLCKLWDDLPPDWAFGLGAYYTRRAPEANEEGRFHVDTLGRRTWGFGYGAYTSHCRELGYITVKSPEQIKAEEEAKLKAEEDAKLKLLAEEEAKKALADKNKKEAEALAKREAEKRKAEAKARLDALATPKPAPTEPLSTGSSDTTKVEPAKQ